MKIIDDGKEIFVKEVEIKGKNMINTCFVLRNENVLLFTFENIKEISYVRQIQKRLSDHKSILL